jgi:hypothetical protein
MLLHGVWSDWLVCERPCYQARALLHTIARVRSTLYLFLSRPPLPRMLSCMPWLSLLPSPPGIVALTTPATMSSPSCRAAQLSPTLATEIIPCAMSASLVGTSSCPFLAPLLEPFNSLPSYTMTSEPPLFLVSLVISIIWSSSMTAH